MIKKGISYDTNHHYAMWKHFLNKVCTLKVKVYGNSSQYKYEYITGIVEKLVQGYDKKYVEKIRFRTKYGGNSYYTMFAVCECMILSDTEAIIFKLEMEGSPWIT